MIEPLRQYPHSIEAEQSLLGALMLNPGAMDRAAGLISETDFHSELHATIFSAIRDCGREADPITVADWFARRQMADDIDNGAYLTTLANDTPGTSNVMGWAKVIRAKSDARRLIESLTEITERALAGDDPQELTRLLQGHVLDWSRTSTRKVRTITQVAADWIDELHDRTDENNRVETGLLDLDEIVQGLLPGELWVIAGRPGMGKTAAAMTILANVTADQWGLMFSAEMSGEQLIQRWASARGLDPAKMRRPSQMVDDDWRSLMATLSELKKQCLMIDDTGGISIDDMAARARLAKRDRDIRLIVVDYMQLLSARSESRFDEVSRISRALKKLAKDLGVPVIALSQLSRKVEERPDKRPRLADLRETGQIEQDADIVTFLYRHGEYDESDRSGITEWITAKHRSGKKGTAYTLFSGARQKFLNADRETIEDYRQSLLQQSSGRQSRFMSGRVA